MRVISTVTRREPVDGGIEMERRHWMMNSIASFLASRVGHIPRTFRRDCFGPEIRGTGKVYHCLALTGFYILASMATAVAAATVLSKKSCGDAF